jgi:hypothetical protein
LHWKLLAGARLVTGRVRWRGAEIIKVEHSKHTRPEKLNRRKGTLMGLIRDWLRNMGEIWEGMAEGDPGAFIGLPRHGKGTGTGHGGTGEGGMPSSLTEHQRQMLNRFFHQQYGRYPLTEFEFQQWLRDNW